MGRGPDLAPGSPEPLGYSAYARLQAKLASLPVIEQAKGIIMAQCGWDAGQAFDALRRTSQRENIKVREFDRLLQRRRDRDQACRVIAQTGSARHP